MRNYNLLGISIKKRKLGKMRLGKRRKRTSCTGSRQLGKKSAAFVRDWIGALSRDGEIDRVDVLMKSVKTLQGVC